MAFLSPYVPEPEPPADRYRPETVTDACSSDPEITLLIGDNDVTQKQPH